MDVDALFGETGKLERCSYGISFNIFMEVQSVETGQKFLSGMADSKPLHTSASEPEQRRSCGMALQPH